MRDISDVRLESLGARLDALTARAVATDDATPESRQKLDHLLAQCDGLREDLVALEALGEPAVPGMTVIIEQALDVLERASAEASAAAEPAAAARGARVRRRATRNGTTLKASATRRK